jgi:hypothetical protein
MARTRKVGGAWWTTPRGTSYRGCIYEAVEDLVCGQCGGEIKTGAKLTRHKSTYRCTTCFPVDQLKRDNFVTDTYTPPAFVRTAKPVSTVEAISPDAVLRLKEDEALDLDSFKLGLNKLLDEEFNGSTFHVEYEDNFRPWIVQQAAREYRAKGWGVKVDIDTQLLTFWVDQAKRVVLRAQAQTPTQAEPPKVFDPVVSTIIPKVRKLALTSNRSAVVEST